MKKINWKIRFKNKVWLTAFISAIVGFVYFVLSMFGVTPRIDQASVISMVGTVLTFLVTIGVIVDPTTSGVGDSNLAMTYGAPKSATQEQIDESGIIMSAEAAESEAEKDV